MSIGLIGLSRRNLLRDGCQSASPTQSAECRRRIDDTFATRYEPSPDWGCQVERLTTKVGISTSQRFDVAVDLMSTVGFGGGVTGHELIVIDGKLLEVLDELALYLTLAEDGLTTVDLATAINRIVAAHMSVRSRFAPRMVFTASLGPSATTRFEQHFDSLAGAFVFHEFGHHWAWSCLDQALQNESLRRGFLPYPQKMEDDADLISGVLSRKAGHQLSEVQLAYDVLTLFGVVQSGQPPDFARVALDYQQQFVSQSSNYSPLAVRKDNVRVGFELGAAAPRFVPDRLLPECAPRTCPKPLISFSCVGQQFTCTRAGDVAGCCSSTSIECPAAAPIACVGSRRCFRRSDPLPADCGGSCDLSARPCCQE